MVTVTRSAKSGYRFSSAELSHTNSYLFPLLEKSLSSYFSKTNHPRRIFDVGCGNGSTAAHLCNLGYDVSGIDPSKEGIEQANSAYPDLVLEEGTAYEPLRERFGQFPVVISLEVVEHVYSPRDYASSIFDMLLPGGMAIVSTPYHGYAKNVALAVSGKLDAHFTALWDHGHIKFWSIRTLRQLLEETGFHNVRFHRVGRLPMFAKSMVAIAEKI